MRKLILSTLLGALIWATAAFSHQGYTEVPEPEVCSPVAVCTAYIKTSETGLWSIDLEARFIDKDCDGRLDYVEIYAVQGDFIAYIETVGVQEAHTTIRKFDENGVDVSVECIDD